MKHHVTIWLAIALIAAMLTGCGNAQPTTPQTEEPATTAAPTEIPTEAPTEAPTETVPATTEAAVPPEMEEDSGIVSEYVDERYAEQIVRYALALSEQWDEVTCFDNGLSGLASAYYEGDPLENVGFGYVDLDNDGSTELVIGAILNAELDPAVFEIWTMVDGEPVMLAQSGYRNRYFLQFSEEDNAWYVANEGSNSAASSGTYYLMLMEGKLEVMQGIVFDAMADEANPWFMAYDLDWDVSNDEPIDEEMANAILENNRGLYTSLEYFPYSLYK